MAIKIVIDFEQIFFEIAYLVDHLDWLMVWWFNLVEHFSAILDDFALPNLYLVLEFSAL